MIVKNKLFPYPVINKQTNLSNFINKHFKLDYDFETDNENIYLKNLKVSTDSQTIFDLYEQGKINFSLIIECSSSVFRKKYNITFEPTNINLHVSELSENVHFSMYGFATQDFELLSDEIDEDYKGITFKIEKYDIICIDDGFNFGVEHSEKEASFYKSIFTIDVNDEMESGPYSVDYEDAKIWITLSKKDYSNYGSISSNPALEKIFFCQLLIPALTEALIFCKQYLSDESKDLDDLGNDYHWFRSIRRNYPFVMGIDHSLTESDIRDMKSPIEVAQRLLGLPFEQSLSKILDLTKSVDVEE